AQTSGDRVDSVVVRDLEEGHETELVGDYFLDATELGDLLPMTGTEYVSGAESRAQTGEPHAAETANPANIQAFTWCFIVDFLDGENHTIERPQDYDFWRNFVPQMDPPWPGAFLNWEYSDPIQRTPR